VAIARRDTQQVRSASSNAPACPAFGVNPVTGDTIVVWMSSFVVAGTTHQAPTDSVGTNTYTQIGATQILGTSDVQLSCWRAENITGGASVVVTGHLAAAVTVTVIAVCLSGAQTPTSYNADTVSAGQISANPASGASTPAPAANSYFMAGTTGNGSSAATTAGSGWTYYTNSSQTDNVTFQDLYIEELTTSTSSSVQNGQFTAASSGWVARVVSVAPLVTPTAYVGSRRLALQQRMG
jgi:hypothetical protein